MLINYSNQCLHDSTVVLMSVTVLNTNLTQNSYLCRFPLSLLFLSSFDREMPRQLSVFSIHFLRMNKKGLQPVSRPVEQIVGAKSVQKCLKN